MILVEVYVPVLDQTDDFELDESVPVSQIVAELVEMLSKKTKSKIPEMMDEFLLCSLDYNEPLNAKRTLSENGIKDGQTLLLV
jgi:hypothetical protein